MKALHNHFTHPEEATTYIPIDKETALRLAQPPEGSDRELWLYELCRFLCEKVNSIIIALFADNPPCSAQTCPEMRASEWQYLCAVHDPPKCCCAIDYCCHTLDWAANTLTSPKHFPSRLSLGTDANNTQQQVRQLTNIFRRVYRIFAHAWFQHREVFWRVEGKSGLYVFFKTVTDIYNLIPEESYTVPPEAEGIETTPINPHPEQRILWKSDMEDHEEKRGGPPDGAEPNVNVSGHTTKLHRQPSGKEVNVAPNTVDEKNKEKQVDELHSQAGPSCKQIVGSNSTGDAEDDGHEEVGSKGNNKELSPTMPSQDPKSSNDSSTVAPVEEEAGNTTEIEIGHELDPSLTIQNESASQESSKDEVKNTDSNSAPIYVDNKQAGKGELASDSVGN